MFSIKIIKFENKKRTSNDRKLQTSKRRQKTKQKNWNDRERNWKKKFLRKKKTMKLIRNKFFFDENMNEWSSDETLCDEYRKYKATKRKKSDFWTKCCCCRKKVRQRSKRLSERKKKEWKKQCEKNIKRAFADQKKERKKKTQINNLSNITFIFIIALFLNFWQSASILNQLIMKIIELFSFFFFSSLSVYNKNDYDTV